MNFSFFLCLAACRMRSSACDTVPRLVSGPCFAAAHSPASALGSTLAPQRIAPPCSSASQLLWRSSTSHAPVHHRLRLLAFPMRTSRQRAGSRTRGLPVPAHGACVHARFFDHAGSPKCLRWRSWTYCLPLHRQRRHPESVFYRGSMVGLHVPLPTLRRHPHGCLRTARGRCGSLFLHRSGLAPLTPCRSPGAPV